MYNTFNSSYLENHNHIIVKKLMKAHQATAWFNSDKGPSRYFASANVWNKNAMINGNS